MDKLMIEGLRLFAYHGVNAEEKQWGQQFLLDITANLDAAAARQSDDLADTVSYAAVLKTARAAFTAESYDLLERAAQVVGDAILAAYPSIAAVTVQLRKPDAPIAAEFAAVGVEIVCARTQNTPAATRRGELCSPADTRQPRGDEPLPPHPSPLKPHQAVIGLGANLGDTQAALDAALAALALLPQTQLLRTSSFYRTAPVECAEPQPDYLNAVALLETTLSPHALLGALLGIEAAHDRARPYVHAPRTLDLDLLIYEGVTLNTPELTVPHPRMADRAFVLVPLAELFPAGDALGFQMTDVRGQKADLQGNAE
ncbi:MAG: 2-amino-4-hydroxy-6-hydroxymethyldihydropteridine diphosphokinase [Oscillospiraceae bacterium]|jgi:dihydroneopterin aldolase/2-amino-4-hydroxy-6-hydroxymethyldihydropteridine diphosphokinase|nr:2-amino-4-hydroxy-6-hydroxymethyldihydropteridine diphosphokinase [Oscillospiraceae bacterium]